MYSPYTTNKFLFKIRSRKEEEAIEIPIQSNRFPHQIQIKENVQREKNKKKKIIFLINFIFLSFSLNSRAINTDGTHHSSSSSALNFSKEAKRFSSLFLLLKPKEFNFISRLITHFFLDASKETSFVNFAFLSLS